jgi:hypothetical protein
VVAELHGHSFDPFATEETAARDLDLVRQRALEPDGERGDEGVEVACVGAQRGREQVELGGLLSAC